MDYGEESEGKILFDDDDSDYWHLTGTPTYGDLMAIRKDCFSLRTRIFGRYGKQMLIYVMNQ